VAIAGQYRGHFGFASALRPHAQALIRDLSSRYRLALLSGDTEKEKARFDALFPAGSWLQFSRGPSEKLDFIRDLQTAGHRVLMVGDGLNDAGALKQSDVGAAVVEEVGAFSPASDVILDSRMVPHLGAVLKLARQTVRIVWASFLLSSAYNLVGISIAAHGSLSPVICAVLMPLSSATVVAFACGATRWAARRTGLLAAAADGCSSADQARGAALRLQAA
jgi:Cu+-exporting ATPase